MVKLQQVEDSILTKYATSNTLQHKSI